MAVPQLYDLVRMTTPTTGTGTLTLGGAVSSFRSFADASVPDGTTVRYALADHGVSPIAREWGTGVYSLGAQTLTRVLGGSSTGSLLNLSGSAHVFITAMEEDFPQGTGISARDSNGAWQQRTITAGNGISVSNGNGASGNPVIAYAPAQVVVTESPHTVGDAEDYILINMTVSGVCTVNLPSASGRGGKPIYLKDTKGIANTYNVTISRAGSDLFEDGSTSFTLYNDFQGQEFIPAYIGTQWTWVAK
jgi:hypothetical protein